MNALKSLLILGLLAAHTACAQTQTQTAQTETAQTQTQTQTAQTAQTEAQTETQKTQTQPDTTSTTTSETESGTCLEVVLTGTQGGPPATNGLAGPGTLVRYGRVENQCSDVLLQFDAGRGTTQRLSQLGLSANKLDAVFLTHLHSDHTEGLVGLMLLRWHFLGKPLDVVCSADATAAERTLSCASFLAGIADPFVQSGEIAQRAAENPRRNPAGPAALVRHSPVPLALTTATPVWKSSDIVVSAISTTHIPGSLAYRVDTPAGSVVIGGDAGNSKRKPPRETSTSAEVEALAQGADILVHSAIHPIFGPQGGSKFPAPIYLRQSNARDLGLLAKRAGVGQLVLTHLIPALNARQHGPFAVPGGALTPEDFEQAVKDTGFNGQIHIGEDLETIKTK